MKKYLYLILILGGLYGFFLNYSNTRLDNESSIFILKALAHSKQEITKENK
ncbi:MAG TPA: hypothetical protein PK079_05060 [Leptospiraceae bacterium]|nr:hypothetical protein [Leptospiraceae bacterium]HMW06240.1 hypothetical protein [Leptospiraceae bacterium]HMX34955.1 hypothetical protein [Leptospiraceae bacterium]HMY31702.1 hypothetical protein [Leptospiraceae bacterium]HMZ65767.1 hypothetical protein [Leptospiraceae bacterium]